MAVAHEALLQESEGRELVRLVVVGSVDDGKSTFIGRLLYEARGLYEDQVAQVRRASRNGEELDFSLFTDGLLAEREQAITIDVAYRYLSMGQRKFIIADTPGHVQYTRNMATGASTADVALILVDARHGVQPQSRRHAYLAHLLGIRRLAVAVNKMDLVGFEAAAFDKIRSELHAYAQKLGFDGVDFFPISATRGDNVAVPSVRMPWHQGGTVLNYLQSVPVSETGEDAPFRFPVQSVVRPNLDYRGYAGQVASGRIAVGEEVVVLPSGRRTHVRAIDTFEGSRTDASAPLSVVLRLEDELDVGRGDLLARPGETPLVARRFEATVVWLHEQPLDPSRSYLVRHTTCRSPGKVEKVHWRLDLESLEPLPAQELGLNDIGRVTLTTHRALVLDPYLSNRTTGSFILVDPLSNATVAAGMVTRAEPAPPSLEVLRPRLAPGERRARLGHHAALVYVERASEDGQRTLVALERALFDRGILAGEASSALEALALVRAGLVSLCVGPLAKAERDAFRSELRVSGETLVESLGEEPLGTLVDRIRQEVL